MVLGIISDMDHSDHSNTYHAVPRFLAREVTGMMREKALRQIVAGEQAELIKNIRFVLSTHSVTAASKIVRIEHLISKHDTKVKEMIEEWYIREGDKVKYGQTLLCYGNDQIQRP